MVQVGSQKFRENFFNYFHIYFLPNVAKSSYGLLLFWIKSKIAPHSPPPPTPKNTD
jgi:hypothetical protein